MSKKGDCYDNAMLESWNHGLKVEAIHGEKFKTRAEAKAHIFEYIELYYTRVRLHSELGYLSPDEFERRVAKWRPRFLGGRSRMCWATKTR